MASYTVKKLATMAGVSVRTLHYYDQVGLLKPATIKENGYRLYGEQELLKLQQILFFRELDFPLDEIGHIVSSPQFDMVAALKDQKHLIDLKRRRLGRLMKTIDATIKKIKKETTMEDKELYGNFSKEEMEKYSAEAKERWGNTEAFKQSQERVAKMGKDGLQRVLEEQGRVAQEIAACMKAGNEPQSAEAQKLIARHYDGLRAFYEPTMEIYRGLAEMYVADERFKKTYETIAPGLAQYMQDAMLEFCSTKEGK